MKTIQTKVAYFSYDSRSRILRMKIVEDASIEVEDAVQNYEAAQSLTGGEKHLLLVDAQANVYISKETRIYSAQTKPNSPLAMALIVNSTANRLIGNFYINFNKPKVPTKLFPNEEKALKWLEEFLYLTVMDPIPSKTPDPKN